jgi:glutathione S-transferase
MSPWSIARSRRVRRELGGIFVAMSLVLYGSEMWNSPYVLSCFVALREKNLPFEVRVIPLHRGAQHEATYTELSLTSRVPALVDGTLSLSESSAIVEYLEDKYPAPGHPRVLPADPVQRSRARQVMAWVRSDVGALRDERSSEYVFAPAGLPPLAPLSEPVGAPPRRWCASRARWSPKTAMRSSAPGAWRTQTWR